MLENKYYNDSFFSELERGSFVSAQKILPIVNSLIQPKSVLDVGCGVGHWLKVCLDELAIEDIQGIEGPYVKDEFISIPIQNLLKADLKKEINLNRKFDLVMSMEVAEHIPEEFADTFVKTLTNHGDFILFSAAIKGQLGTYHINEQMPEYWASKFEAHNYIAVDIVRPRIWNDKEIAYWYRQNTILFVKENVLNNFSQLAEIAKITDPNFLTRIHPEKYFAYVDEHKQLKSPFGWLMYHYLKLKKSVKNRK